MKYKNFTIKNFKGIQELEFDLAKYPQGNVFPCVGLNEAGKTTILEAVDFFQNDSKLSYLEKHKLIHKRDSANFSGNIEISSILEFEQSEKDLIKNTINSKYSYIEDEINFVVITRKWSFENAEFKKREADQWIFNGKGIFVKKRTDSQYKNLYQDDKEMWQTIVDELKSLLPKIIYFPNFYFKFPEKIYLKEVTNLAASEEEKRSLLEYRQIIDDVLRTIRPEYSLVDFLSKLEDLQNPSKQSAARSIKQDISNVLNKKIIEHWKNIFPSKPITSVVVDTTFDANNFYLNIKTNVGGKEFEIQEGSLGFQWFFSFILFTEFRKKREGESGEYLFLFDEPANNLHEGSQTRLLNLLQEIAKGAKIIYTTHSPYLIDDKNILNTFIVKDEGFQIDGELTYTQNVKAYPYRIFNSNINMSGNDQTMHFRPVLDHLEYKEHVFIPSGKIVFTEGKSDYYLFKLIKNKYFPNDDFNFYPGTSVDKYETVFREYLANNRKFIAIFDSDAAGINAKKRYLNEISVELESKIFIYRDIYDDFADFDLESLIIENDRLSIQKIIFPDEETYGKGKFITAIQDIYLNNKNIELSDKTKLNFEKVFEFIKKKFEEN